jgi:AcrR family transcriptional regulator
MPKVVPGYKEAARSKIVEAGFRIFSTKGYSESTMDDVAAVLGVSKGAIYLYFGGKEDLLEAIYKWSQNKLRDTLQSAFRGKDLDSALEEAYKQLFEERKPHIKIMFEMTGIATHDERVRSILRGYQESYFAIVHELVLEQAKRGLAKKADTRLMAEMLSALYSGLARMSVLGLPPSLIHRIWMESFAVIVRVERPGERDTNSSRSGHDE